MFTGIAKEKYNDFVVKNKIYEKLTFVNYNDEDEKYERGVKSLEHVGFTIPLLWGVVQDFADSLDIELYVEFYKDMNDRYYSYSVNQIRGDVKFQGDYISTINEARIKAIEKLSQIINDD